MPSRRDLAGRRLFGAGYRHHHHRLDRDREDLPDSRHRPLLSEGATGRDYPLVMGVTMFYGAIVIGANIATDIVRSWLDPKVSYD